jgi:hypothetical protein
MCLNLRQAFRRAQQKQQSHFAVPQLLSALWARAMHLGCAVFFMAVADQFFALKYILFFGRRLRDLGIYNISNAFSAAA